MTYQRIFGPVPSRRLGRSLGINNIPPKVCTYACVYCQLGHATGMTHQRKEFYDPLKLAQEVQDKLQILQKRGEQIDYLTIVPDGEPTLDLNLGKLVGHLKTLDQKIALISNATLLHLPEVRNDLAEIDWVSVKVDSVNQEIWKKVDRPHGRLEMSNLLSGIKEFSDQFQGTLVSETMLVRGVNDGEENLREVASFLSEINPARAYLSIPTRPPAEDWVLPPTEERVNQGFQIFKEKGLNAEYLIGYEGNEFSSTGDLETDLLSISAVHPMREDAVQEYLSQTGAEEDMVKRLVSEGKLVVSEYQGDQYYIRSFARG